MLIPITIFIPNFKDPVAFFDGQVVIRKISNEELETFLGVMVNFENQRPKNIKSLGNREDSLYKRLFSPDSVSFHTGEFISIPYFVIDVNSKELASDFLFALRILKVEHILAPFGFENNQKSLHIFHPTTTTSEFDDYRFVLKDDDLVSLANLVGFIEIIKSDPKYKIIKERYLGTLHWQVSNKVRYIEWVSIIESIILNRVSNAENNVSNRFKNQLHENLSEISKLQSNEIYRRRSEVVHSGFFNNAIDDNSKMYSINNLHLHTQKIIRAYIKKEIKDENPCDVEDTRIKRFLKCFKNIF